MRPIRYGDIRQILTSVADTTVTIVSPTKRHFLIQGSAAMYVLVLPDARTIQRGTPFIFENMSSEFIGVRNSDSTTWHRIPPRATLTCVLGTQATAAGTWYSMVHDPATGNPAFGYCQTLDFVGNTISGTGYFGDGGLTLVISGAGAVVGITTVSSPGKQGTMSWAAGTTNTGYALSHSGLTPCYVSGGCRAFEALITVAALSAAADEYILRAGFGNNLTGGAHTEGAYFLYDRLTAGIVNWQVKTIKTAGGAGTTQTDTGIAVTADATVTTLQKLRVEINSAGTRADFFVNKVQASVAGGVANLPAATTALKSSHIGVTSSAYAAATKLVFADYIRTQSYPTTPR